MPITFATVGTMAAPGFYVRRGAGLRKVKLPNTCAVVERPNGLLLIDTGWSRAQCAAPVRNPGRFRKWALSLNVRPGDELASQLRTMGYVASDVRDIVVTHLHVDHVGGIDDFPLARVHLSRAEWAQRARRGIRGYDPRSLGFEDRTVAHELDGPAALGFGASKDLFGDGSVLILDARGHTLGSVAVAVRLERGFLLHAGDACMFRSDYAESARPSRYARVQSQDLGAQQRTFACFRAAEREHGATVVPSHDWTAFRTLPHQRDAALR